MDKTRELRLQLSNEAIAGLLKIPMADYHHLSHKPIQAFRDFRGNVIEFYIHISANNRPGVLQKLKLDSRNFVRFRPDHVYKAVVALPASL